MTSISSTRPFSSPPEVLDKTPKKPLFPKEDTVIQPPKEENVDKPSPNEPSLDELFLRVLQEQIERDRNASENPPTENTLPPFVVPRGKEELFNAPLNRPLLERDYSLWKRLFGISQFVFTQSALQFQGISKGSMLLGAATGALLTNYFPVYSVVGLSAYSGYCSLKNFAKALLGSDSLEERKDIWEARVSNESFSQKISRKLSALMGTDSIFDRAKNAVWGVAQAYLVTIGRDFLFQRQDNPWTSSAIQLFKGAQDWILPIPAAIAAGGIGYFGLMIALAINASSAHKFNDQFEGFTEDMSFNGEYRRLLYLSDEEYESELFKAMGAIREAQFDEQKREYAQKVRARMRLKKYLGADQVQIDAKASLKKLSSSHPYRALKAVLAQFHVLTKRKQLALGHYQSLLNQHAYPEAHTFLNQVLKPLLLKVEFLKQTLLDPTRPPLGLLMNEGSEYYSYISVLSGTEIKEKITLTDPKELEKFFSNLLINETAIHKYLCFERGVMQVDPAYLMRQAESL